MPQPALRPALFVLGLALLPPLLLLPAVGEAQMPPLPSDSRLQEGFYAWDRGDYPEAIGRYLEVLRAPGGGAFRDEIALLTGELFRVEEADLDGRSGLRVGPTSRWATYETVEAGSPVTRVIDLVSGGGPVLSVGGIGAALTGSDHLAYLVAGATVEDRILRLRALPGGAEQVVDLQGWIPRGPTNSVAGVILGDPEGDALYLLASRETLGNPTDILRLTSSGELTVLPTGEGGKSAILPIPGGRFVAFQATAAPGSPLGSALVVLDLATGEATRFPGRSAATISADGGTLAALSREGAEYHLEVISLNGVRPGTPQLLLSTAMELAAPALSPSGRRVAFQGRPVHDWEIFALATDGGGILFQVTDEIQHDLLPRFIGESVVMALKGEARHRRSYLYDLESGAETKLFHNNTIRTIAPEYEWQVTPDGSTVVIMADRDGDTISPERGVYLLRLDERVSETELMARLEGMLAEELALRARGEATFQAIAQEVAQVTGEVSVERIYQYARTLYSFGSKFITQPGNHLAITYIEGQLREWGYETELQWFEPRPGVMTANVIARLPGTVDPDLVYVVSSHFDSVERGPGADDNSSGSTALLEAARAMRHTPQPATIEFAWFTGEEAGLLGSREYVRRAVADGKQIVGALNNDMIGWSNDHRLDNTIRYSNPGIRDIQHAAAIQFSRLITYDALYYRSTDAAAYYEAYGDIVGGIGSYPVLGNPHYHQPTDRLETINQPLVAEVSRVTAATLMLLASSPARLEEVIWTPGGAPGNGTLHWSPARERGVSLYRISYETPSGETVEVDTRWAPQGGAARPSLALTGVRPGSEVRVRGVSDRGTAGWDWARAIALP